MTALRSRFWWVSDLSHSRWWWPSSTWHLVPGGSIVPGKLLTTSRPSLYKQPPHVTPKVNRPVFPFRLLSVPRSPEDVSSFVAPAGEEDGQPHSCGRLKKNILLFEILDFLPTAAVTRRPDFPCPWSSESVADVTPRECHQSADAKIRLRYIGHFIFIFFYTIDYKICDTYTSG